MAFVVDAVAVFTDDHTTLGTHEETIAVWDTWMASQYQKRVVAQRNQKSSPVWHCSQNSHFSAEMRWTSLYVFNSTREAGQQIHDLVQ